MPSSHLSLCRPLLLLPPIPPSIRVFSKESALRIRWPKYWSFSLSTSPAVKPQDWPLGWTGWLRCYRRTERSWNTLLLFIAGAAVRGAVTGPLCVTVFCIVRMRCAPLSHSAVSDSETPWAVARQAPLSMGFSRQEYWSGLPCPPPGDLLDPGTEPRSPALQVDFYRLSHKGSPGIRECIAGRFFTSWAATEARWFEQLSPFIENKVI